MLCSISCTPCTVSSKSYLIIIIIIITDMIGVHMQLPYKTNSEAGMELQVIAVGVVAQGRRSDVGNMVASVDEDHLVASVVGSDDVPIRQSWDGALQCSVL